MFNHSPIEESIAQQYSPLLLAYIGDAVYELMVRTSLVASGPKRIKDIHLAAVEMVKAGYQANALKWLENELTEVEQAVVRRGRNTHSSLPKNSDLYEYRLSTGFEALVGYLYLIGNMERLQYIFKRCLKEQ